MHACADPYHSGPEDGDEAGDKKEEPVYARGKANMPDALRGHGDEQAGGRAQGGAGASGTTWREGGGNDDCIEFRSRGSAGGSLGRMARVNPATLSTPVSASLLALQEQVERGEEGRGR